jgi:hypothetical protein
LAFDEDLSAFFDPADFADVAVVEPADGAPSFEVKGIFDAPHVLGQARDVRIVTDRPTLMCRSVDGERIKREDRLTVKGQTYDVLEVEPDGTGVSTVVLSIP